MKPVTTTLAEKIADRLFTNGVDEVADRLVLELRGKQDLGGWCRGAVIDQINAVLNEAFNAKR